MNQQLPSPQEPQAQPQIIVPTWDEYYHLFQTDDQYTIDDLRSYLSSFNLSSILSSLSTASASLFQTIFEYRRGQAIADFLTPFIAKEAIRVSSDIVPYTFNETN